MIQIDEKFKDAVPKETVKRIRNILQENSVTVTEEFGDSGIKNCYSLRLSVNGIDDGTNGKGVTETLARASAYAELMERLQSDNLIYQSNAHTRFSDAKQLNKAELLSECGKYFDIIAKSNPKSNGTLTTADEIAELCILYGNGESAKVIPYLNITNGEMTCFPTDLTRLYSTTGLAAGNSIEEALVQGLSEIFERHCKLRIMREKIVPPAISDDYLKQYPDTYETIEAIRDAGYDVTVKDCSLDTPFPVLAALLVDKRTHSYHVHLGCHPIFEIALRRTLTETFQGRTLANVASINTIVSANSYKLTQSEIMNNMAKSIATYPAEFFGASEYEFKPYKNRTDMNNKELLCEIIDYLKSRGYDILIRDHSSLGFPTYRILVPGFCEPLPFFIETGTVEQTIKHMYNSLPGTYLNLTKEKAMIRIKMEELRLNRINRFLFTKAFSCPVNLDNKTDVALYHLNMAYLQWEAGNKPVAFEHLSRACKACDEYDFDYLSCLSNWLKCDKNCENVRTLLSPFYYDSVLDEVENALANGNPFKKYAHNCDETNCEECKYKDICKKKTQLKLKDKVNAAIEAFDDEAAFERIKAFFAKLSK